MKIRNDKYQIIPFWQQKKIKKKRQKDLKNAWFGKNVVKKQTQKFLFFEKLIKFFIKIILWMVISKVVLKNKTKTNELIDRTFKKFNSKDFGFIPYSTAFYFLISFVPIITLLIFLLSIIPNYEKIFVEEIINKILPGVSSLINLSKGINSLGNAATYATIAILLFSSIWLASSGFGKFIYSQNYIYDHNNLGSWLKNRTKGMLIVIGIILYLFITSTFYIFIYDAFNKNITSTIGKNIFFYTSFLIYLFLIMYLGIGLLYIFSPAFKLSWSMINPGILITTIPNVIFIGIFGTLTSLIDYGKYGIIGTFMYVAMFISFLTYFMYLGIVANEAYYKTFFSTRTISKKY